MKNCKFTFLLPIFFSLMSFVSPRKMLGEVKFEMLKNIEKDFIGLSISAPNYVDYFDSKMICHNVLDGAGKIKGSFGILPNGEIGFYQTGNLSYESFFDDFKEIESEADVQVASYAQKSTVNYSKFVQGPSHKYEESKSGFHFEGHLNDMPEYYQDYPSYLPFNNGCAPTSSAMLIGFYDHYIESFSNLVPNAVMPINHDGNKSLVTNKIVELANLMGTDMNGINGTRLDYQIAGITNYLFNNYHFNYRAFNITPYSKNDSFDLAQGIINNTKNPFLAFLKTGKRLGHSVLVIGWQIIRTGEKYIATHKCYSNERGLRYYNVDMVVNYTYVSRWLL